MATENTKILTAEQEQQLRQPIDEYVGGIQAKIDALRKDGTDQVVEIQSSMDSLKRDRIYTQQEKEAKLAQYKPTWRRPRPWRARTRPRWTSSSLRRRAT